MLLSSVIIILREVLEAALLFSILFAFSKQLNINLKWFVLAVVIGLSGALLYALNLGEISNWFDGVGQEVINAFIQYALYLLLLFYMVYYVRLKHTHTDNSYPLSNASTSIISLLLIFILSLAIIREGSEIILYIVSALHRKGHIFPVVTGVFIGSGIGLSIGFLFYYLLINIASKWAEKTGLTLLILVSAGMISQATLLLIQADWLPSQLPLWNTSDWLSERSTLGQLLYALIGYEATPSALQFTFYLSGLLLPVVVLIIQSKILLHTLSPKNILQD